MFVDELVCMLNLRFCLVWPFGVGLGGFGFFELTNDDSGDCLLVDRVLSGFFFVGWMAVGPRVGGCMVVWFSMESLILAQDERWRRA